MGGVTIAIGAGRKTVGRRPIVQPAGGRMSEYQYYEFAAIDGPLSAGDREELRAISSRARISATSFSTAMTSAISRPIR
jgi:hypothetical protein